MTLYKATDPDGKTKTGMTWAVGVTNRALGDGTQLCTDGVLHCYETPEQAAFMLPAHANGYTRLFEVQTPGIVANDGTKCGVKEATVIREIAFPTLSTEQRVTIAIKAALLVFATEKYVRWAEGWLSGKDRTSSEAWAACRTADAAAYAADAATLAAGSHSEDRAADLADSAAMAVEAATGIINPLPLISIIKEVMA